jgi:hypothetical protein
MTAYRSGDFDGARAKFRAVVNADPSRADAVSLLGRSEDALLELLVAGGEFETFAREILAASAAASRELVRDADAAAKAAEGVFAENLAERQQAIFALGMQFGPFGAPPLVAELAGNSEGRRLAAIYALSRMGSSVVVPLLAASHSDEESVRMGVLHVFNKLNDPRTAARVADMAMNDASGQVQALAAAIQTQRGEPAQMYVDQAWAWFTGDGARGLSAVENYGVVWACEGSRLEPVEVPMNVVALELAKHALHHALALGHPEAMMRMGAVIAAEVGALSGNDEWAEQAAAQRNALMTIPHGALNDALVWAVDADEPMIASALISALDGPGGRDWSGFRAALAGRQAGPRVGAAIALAKQDVFNGDVIEALAEALGYAAIRVVQIMDGDAQRAGALAAALQAQGVTVVTSGKGAQGLANMRMAMNVDAFVVADPLPDYYAKRVVEVIRADARFGETPIFVIGGEDTEVEGAEVVEAVDAAAVVAAFAELDAGRAGYEATAAEAARGLAHAAHDGMGGRGVAALVAALGRADAIAVRALTALGYAGDASTAGAIQAVVADGSRSSEVRTAAANAAANLVTRGGAQFDAAVFAAAMGEGDAAVAAACARVIGLMGGGQLSGHGSLE